MKKYNTVISNMYNHLNEQPEPPGGPPSPVDPAAPPGPVDPAAVPPPEVPPEEAESLEPAVDLQTVDKLRQALLVNRDEIDYDEYSIVQQAITSDNVELVADTIDSILGKSVENTGAVQADGPS
jgi:hypothetical protein